jgi:hypothetical protein
MPCHDALANNPGQSGYQGQTRRKQKFGILSWRMGSTRARACAPFCFDVAVVRTLSSIALAKMKGFFQDAQEEKTS